MVAISKKKRLYNSMGYRDLQRSNSQRIRLLSKEDRDWLKINRHKNVGWDHIIQLHRKINDFLESYQKDGMSLEELFLEAERIGNKYQSPTEINTFNEALSATMESISQKIDRYFPEEEPEMIDFRPHRSTASNNRSSKKRKR